MNIKKTLFAALVAMTGLTANAQEEIEYVFQPHWYIQGQVGGQYTLGEVDFSELLSPTAQVGLGYQFSKVTGLRLSVNAWQSKGGSELGLPKTYTWKWNYVAPKLAATFNLSNLFAGYNPTRKWNVSAFAGLGANIGFGNKEANDLYNSGELIDAWEIQNDMKVPEGSKAESQVYLSDNWTGSKIRLMGELGLALDYNVTDRLQLGLEVNANTLSDTYNSKHAGNSDWYFNAMVGLKYALGNTYEKRVKSPETSEAMAQLQRAQAELARARAELVKAQEAAKKANVAPVTNARAKTAEREALRRDVFFSIASTKVTEAEMVKVMEIADYLNKYPEAKVAITGYADKGTGNPKINMGLSIKRAAVVKDLLINKYKIAANRITTDAKGDTVQPFTVEILNRVSICIAE